MAKSIYETSNKSVAEIEAELRDIERQLRVQPTNESSGIAALLASVFVIVASVAGLPLGILGVVFIARQMRQRRRLLGKVARLDRKLVTMRKS
ncbi:MAG TPA: hypothetical protein VGK87_05070 [Anaerolineae bacterium]|jgi:hypothetical protein